MLNADDAKGDRNILTQSLATEATSESVIQRYYRILTSDFLPIYGASEFAQSQDTELLFFNTMGKDYRLAAGDVLRVTLRGITESDNSYKIGRDGNLILPALPPFSVSGLSIAEAEKKLLDVLRYDDASAVVYMSLETARLITVQVSGAISQPRTVAVPAYTPLSRVLAYAGGIKPTGSLRNIVLRDRDGNVNQVDFYEFLQSPAGANDPLVTDSSRVFIGNQGNTIAAIGFVARPGIYELPEGQDAIPVKDILDLTGTRILPPGLELEALFFDAKGLSQSRVITRDDILIAGEVLSIRFLPTRLTDVIRVKGAVLEDYQIATSQPISVGEIIRGGATLTENASRDLALVIGEGASSRVIDIEQALINQEISIAPGEVLHIFTPEDLREVARIDVNRSDSIILRGFVEAEAAELFLNGERLSFLPIGNTDPFDEVIRPFYRLTPDTNLELAIIEDGEGNAKALSLRSLLLQTDNFAVNDGDKIHLFDNQFLAIGAPRLETIDTSRLSGTNATNMSARNTYEDWRNVSSLFSRAGVLRVKVDDELRTFLPSAEVVSIAEAIDALGFDNLSRFSDLVLVEKNTLEDREDYLLRSLSGDLSQGLPIGASTITFFSENGKQELLSQVNTSQFNAVTGRALNIFVDYKLKDIGIASDLLSSRSEVAQKIFDTTVYPLFAIYEFYDETQNFWQKEAVSLAQLKSASFIAEISPGARVMVFTSDYLSKLLGSDSGSDASQQLTGLQAARIDVQAEPGSNAEQDPEAQFLARTNQKADDITVLSPNIQFILSSSRYISGAVETSGYYPVAGDITLSQMLSAAGGLTENADITRLEIIKQRVLDGKILADKVSRVDLISSDASGIRLNDRYSINVPLLINEAETGIVTLNGEVSRPGEYIIARDETLHDLITRAGGLTDVAYPLGAVFTRESLQESQRESNAILAGQLEQAVLQVAQSDTSDAGEQVKAVLGYAQRLRQQDVTGRLSVNVSLADVSAPVYLQSGDVLMIPKRPAHVSVIGSVQKDTVSSYSADKRLSAYLTSAGGTNRLADIKRAYILLPNGESTEANEESMIPPGAVIVVPPKTDRLTVLGLTELVSRVLGNIATSVLAINNVR
ncbi:MAG: SLBB domain-containing protein [Yoonia sp.]|nr:SLBB domain-containing protein [Yoonia sp.]